MNDKIYKTLEYNKIIHKLTTFAATSLGKSRASALLPEVILEDVKQLLSATDQAVMVNRLKGGAPFGGIRDITAALHRARIGGMLNPSELLDIANTHAGGKKLKRYLLSIHENNPIPHLAELSLSYEEHKTLEDHIRQCIGDDAEVLDSASSELSRIRHDIRLNESRARERLEQMIRTPSIQKMLQEQLVTMRNDRYVIPVKQEYRNQLSGMVHDQSASGATLFIEPEAIVNMNNKLRELKIKEGNEIIKILTRLTIMVGELTESLVHGTKVIAELDFIFAKAGLSNEMKASLPIMNDRGYIKLKKARHPLIPSEQVVPTDLELGNTFTAIIVTGPNTGGKTVSLKTVGLLSLMAMSGLFVPAEDGSQLCVFDGIYADIGDEQSIEQNLSTFSSHMTNIISILKDLTPKSLILLDELGAGTDPAEGSSLAIALLEYIHQFGCRMIATTHYSELKAYAYDRKGVVNASMEFNVQTLSPTYRLLVGVPGRSNAFAIAERLGLPKSLIDAARGHVTEEGQRVESMIATLESNRISTEAERASAEQLKKEAEQIRKKLTDDQQKFGEQRDRLVAKAQQEAREIIAKAKQEAEEVITELRKMALEEQASVKEHKLIEAKRRLDQASPGLQVVKHSVPVHGNRSQADIQAGDEVQVPHLKQKGHVVELASETEALVQIGVMKLKIRKDELELIKHKETKTIKTSGASLKRTRDENVRLELDLRGNNLEEALIEVDRFLDEAYLSGLGQVQIIHGKGTGVLRSGIQDYMKRHKHIKQYRLGNYGEGGTGVTVVELK